VQAYPYACDVPALVAAVAEELGQPPAAQLLAPGGAHDMAA